jgi:hypothetical protein
MPHLVEMQKQYGKDGLVVISVSLDEDPENKETQQKVAKVLTTQKANFVNFILDEKLEFWQKKLNFDGPPSIYVFDRDGAKKHFKDNFEIEDVEKWVGDVMKK